MKRRHDMPFGAECLEKGRAVFRLWAPAASKVDLVLEYGAGVQRQKMARLERNWFELMTEAEPGTKYRYQIDGEQEVPDPASRFQPKDVHGPSELIDAGAFEWKDESWRGRPWREAVIYELHVGTFTQEGTFGAVSERLDYLADLGVTAIELMPVGDFPGQRDWGYDGVFMFAPDSRYGGPGELKQLIQSAHERGLMVLLDVVYNHFGPEGNYLNSYAPQFFTNRHHTPWGNGINFDGRDSDVVRDFFVHNALYWLVEYNFDGLRLDAVHAIIDDSKKYFLDELADAVHSSITPDRHVHLILENDRNESHLLKGTPACKSRAYTAQWNDDLHHCLHVLLTGEGAGYYADYADQPVDKLGRCLTEGFAYQGEYSIFRDGKPRGQPSADLPPTAFVSFLQNHDQAGNRAFGERIHTLANPQAVRAATAILLLAPSPPLLFMGEEFGTETPFLFFCDFEPGLAEAVAAGRRNEFARFEKYLDPAVRAGIPDPNAKETFNASRLNWNELSQAEHRAWFSFHQELLQLRREYIFPRLCETCRVEASRARQGERGLSVSWRFSDGSQLSLLANLGADKLSRAELPAGQTIYSTEQTGAQESQHVELPAWFVGWFLRK